MACAHMALGGEKWMRKQTSQKLLEHIKRNFKKDGFNRLMLCKTKKTGKTHMHAQNCIQNAARSLLKY